MDGLPSEKPVLTPKIVPFFVGRKKIDLIAACRSRSIAITLEGEVYEWGFLGTTYEDKTRQQFELVHTLPEKAVSVKLGLEFNLYLSNQGNVWIYGAISQEGSNVINTWGQLINMNEKMQEKV